MAIGASARLVAPRNAYGASTSSVPCYKLSESMEHWVHTRVTALQNAIAGSQDFDELVGKCKKMGRRR
jgi:hypothetical protein